MSHQILILLVGAIVGSYFTHFYQKKHWLYQKRIEAFAELIEIIYRQREACLKYAFSKQISNQERFTRVSADFAPVRAKLYLASFMLSPEGQKEVKDVVLGFQQRLHDAEQHPFPESNEYLAFEHEIERLHTFLQVEITTSWFRRGTWYTRLARSRRDFEEWKKTELPKLIEQTGKDLQKVLSGSKNK